MSNFKGQVLTLANAGTGYIIKQGRMLHNPTIEDIADESRKLSASVQGSICMALKGTSLTKPKTVTSFHKQGLMVFVYVIVYYSIEDSGNLE